ncbi:phosphatidylglycerophosphatase A [Engelhardtia mirabilis]|uniref:Phosphatidylglycerophosphatase A n=1 Tax=Engelhardtia mirabilis TaxID=2528011 RepID=A0A518BRT1_9BACT|nr:Phosphatidylglycerophosphatase A [Planctomycetes bacterium Pla133]QDV04008.1 Phosphatidylglycerophosphatase A [Planctomycetes bacterium Pla86]
MDKLKLGIVSCGYLGCSPFAPGTFGTLGGVAIAWGLSFTGNFAVWSLVAAVLVYLVGRSLGDWSEAYAGKKDPGIFVLDEVVGYLVTVWWLGSPTYLTLIVGFFVFRLFDIVKPPPARRMERLGGGDGILLDDVVAGLYGLAVMAAARLLLLEPANWTLVG